MKKLFSKKSEKKTVSKDFSFLTRPRFSAKDQTLFAKRLAFLVRAGVPMINSLEMLRKQAKSRSKKILYERLIADTANGQFLSTSLAKFRYVFGDFAVNIIRVGETGGILGQNLNYLAEELKKKHVLKRKVVSAMVYPIIITLATIGLTSLLTVYIFPKILPIFTSLHVPLPFTTRVLIFLSTLLRDHGVLIVMVAIVAVIGTIASVKMIQKIHRLFDALLLKLPVVGSIVKNYNLSNICRTLGLLLKSGTRVVEAISVTAGTTANSIYNTELKEVAAVVSTGQKISKRLEENPKLFPDVCSELVSVGEGTGNLPETLMYLSEMYEHELDEAIKSLSSAIEPALMIIMGFVVGFVAVSIITPIYQITQTLGH